MDYSKAINDLNAQVSALQNRSDSLANALKITNSNLTSLSKSVDSIKIELTSINAQLVELTSQLTAANANITLIASQILTLNQQYAALLAQLNAILTQLAGGDSSTLSNGLVAYYPFNGNANDSSGYLNDGTVNGATLSNDRFNNSNSSFLFNGINNYIRLKPISLGQTQEFSISVWIKPVDITTNRYYTITRQEDPVPNSGQDWILAFQEFGTVLAFGVKTTVNYDELNASISSINFTDNKWHNITAVYNGNNRYIYVDDILVGSDIKSGNMNVTNNLYGSIGSTSGSLEEFFNGNIDDLRFYNRALKQTEITYLATH